MIIYLHNYIKSILKIYIDTENSIDLEGITKFGIENTPDKLRLIRSNKVEDINIAITQLLDELKEAKLGGYEIPKILTATLSPPIFVDSRKSARDNQ